ncbi:MAG: hypothetical protein B6I38_03690 [Anaerolineaceae bacterium 4572_5.1]|nr:MAG: hypothetical protein B6I38_03690 [Anaerolineaceae bacterium 4572_5.1]
MPYFNAILGVILLAYGRKVFWLFIGALGYATGLRVAEQTFGSSSNISVVLAVVAGVVAALIAIFLQKIAVGLAGLLAGAYLTINLIETFQIELGELSWLAILIGALIGAALLLSIFDWALIILSSFVGAGMIVETVASPKAGATLLFILLTAVGVGIQANLLRKEG